MEKIPLISKGAYGFGDVGCNFSWMFLSVIFDDILYRRVRNQYGGCVSTDAFFKILGCNQ